MGIRVFQYFFFILAALILYGCAHSAQSVPSAGGDVSDPDPSFPALRAEAAPDFSLSVPVYKFYDLSKLRVGMSKTEVLSIFAKPKTTKRTPNDEYWEYTRFELYFRDGRLVNWFDF